MPNPLIVSLLFSQKQYLFIRIPAAFIL
ncbi:MAG: hypothetical protein MRECE_5c023 [Mycoplasmataceae bacterium CE_OT135]|nr:MAG: hypothetical protein MRECE_5c023 [Mycoplasmataceae bacterium CE_OT135]